MGFSLGRGQADGRIAKYQRILGGTACRCSRAWDAGNRAWTGRVRSWLRDVVAKVPIDWADDRFGFAGCGDARGGVSRC